MLNINKLVAYTVEQRDLQVNAPTFIYNIAYNKKPPSLRGRSNHKQKKFKDILVDKKIPTKSLKDLNKIKEIEMRASCQGDSYDKPTFIIFRPIDQDKDKIKKLVKNLNRFSNVKAGSDMGNDGKYRIGITSPDLWYNKEKIKMFNTFWEELPIIIRKSII